MNDLGLRQLCDLLEHIGEGVCITDKNHRIVYANRGMAGILGVDVESLIGAPFLEHCPKMSEETFRQNYFEAAESCTLREFECGLVCPAGHRTRQRGRLNPIVEKGQFAGMVCAFLCDAGRAAISDTRACTGSGGMPAGACLECEAIPLDLQEILPREWSSFRLVMEHSPVAQLLVDPSNWLIVDGNAMAEKLLGCTRGELRGTTVPDFAIDLNPVLAATLVKSAFMLGHAQFTTRIRCNGDMFLDAAVTLVGLQTGDGARVHLSFIASTQQMGGLPKGAPIHAEQHAHPGQASIGSADVDSGEAACVEHQTEMIESEKEGSAAMRFVAAASHDLSQPLSALSLYFGVVNSRVPADCKAMMSNIQNCLDSMSDVVKNLQDIGKLGEGMISPDRSDFFIGEVVEPLVAALSIEAGLKGLDLRCRASGAVVYTDSLLLSRILRHLLANAIRYTDRGGVLIGCRCRQGKLSIEIWDTGVGIARGDCSEMIVEGLRQPGKPALKRGSPLELEIVEKIARLLDVKIRMISWPGKGSLFAVEVPLGRANSVVEEAPVSNSSRLLRIGIVEDDFAVLEALTLALEDIGHHVTAATSGDELIEKLNACDQLPDLVISDYHFANGKNGLEVIMAAKATFGSALPALLVTGDTDPVLLRNLADRGIAVICKPLQLATLHAFVKQLTERRSSQNRV